MISPLFPFPFYGHELTEFYITTHGFLSLSPRYITTHMLYRAGNFCFEPSLSSSQNLIYFRALLSSPSKAWLRI